MHIKTVVKTTTEYYLKNEQKKLRIAIKTYLGTPVL